MLTQVFNFLLGSELWTYSCLYTKFGGTKDWFDVLTQYINFDNLRLVVYRRIKRCLKRHRPYFGRSANLATAGHCTDEIDYQLGTGCGGQTVDIPLRPNLKQADARNGSFGGNSSDQIGGFIKGQPPRPRYSTPGVMAVSNASLSMVVK